MNMIKNYLRNNEKSNHEENLDQKQWRKRKRMYTLAERKRTYCSRISALWTPNNVRLSNWGAISRLPICLLHVFVILKKNNGTNETNVQNNAHKIKNMIKFKSNTMKKQWIMIKTMSKTMKTVQNSDSNYVQNSENYWGTASLAAWWIFRPLAFDPVE